MKYALDEDCIDIHVREDRESGPMDVEDMRIMYQNIRAFSKSFIRVINTEIQKIEDLADMKDEEKYDILKCSIYGLLATIISHRDDDLRYEVRKMMSDLMFMSFLNRLRKETENE